ncbi:MAG: M23 family metallopeptidase [Bacteroidota bacterium]
MKHIYWVWSVWLLASCSGPASADRQPVAGHTGPPADTIAASACSLFAGIEKKIRDGLTGKEELRSMIIQALPLVHEAYYANGGKDHSSKDWVFPLRGYTAQSIGGKNGEGYVEGSYDFLDGNKHTGHPAHDIFINDADQDCLDDKTKQPVSVLSVSGGIVVSTETQWDSASGLRGGRYIWIYEPHTASLYYYAHNDSVLVSVCQVVKPGDRIATVGRTGLNAFKRRSPTHLHLMVLRLDSGMALRPFNPYKDLLGAKTVPL